MIAAGVALMSAAVHAEVSEVKITKQFGLGFLPLMVMEVYLILSVESGHRLGDVMGDTEVVEAKRS